MGKNKKAAKTANVIKKETTVVEAPIVENPVIEEVKEDAPKKESVVNVVDLGKLSEQMLNRTAGGLDPNHQVDLLKMAHETFRMDPEAAKRYGMSDEAVEKINHITAIGQVAVLTNEIIYAENPFAITMRQSQLQLMSEAAQEIGVTIDQKMLPAPDKDGNIQVPSTAVKVSAQTKKKIQKENTIINSKEPDMDVTKMNDENLKDALVYLLSKRVSVFDNIQRAISLYVAYKNFVASKAENKDKQLAEIAKLTRVDLLNEIVDIVKEAPIVVGGIGNFMYSVTNGTKSPISAFCHFRNTAVNRQTGVATVDDQFIADLTRCLIIWAQKIKLDDNNKSIEAVKKNLEVLKKDEKKNAEAIEDQNKRLETLNNNIAYINKTVEYVTNPESDIVDGLIDAYNQNDIAAKRIFKAIVDSYYHDIDVKTVKQDLLKKNVQQYAGVITNMFRDPLSQLLEYKEANIVELEYIPTRSDETLTTEEPTENPTEDEQKN